MAAADGPDAAALAEKLARAELALQTAQQEAKHRTFQMESLEAALAQQKQKYAQTATELAELVGQLRQEGQQREQLTAALAKKNEVRARS